MSQVSTSVQSPPQQIGYRAVLSLTNYRNLLFAQSVSDLGDGVYAMALLWAMKELTGSAVMMSAVVIAEVVPMILLGIFAGMFVDLGSKKAYMVMSDIVRGIVVAFLALLWWLQLLQPWMLVVGAAILASFSAFFTPARTVTVRMLVGKKLIMQAQSLQQTINTIIGLCAPAIAALLLSIDIGLAFLVNSVSFFLSFLFISLIRNEEVSKKRDGKIDFPGIRANLKEGFRTILTVPILRNLILYLMLLNMLFAPISVLFPLYADTASVLAAYQIFFFAGLLVGSVTVGFLSKMAKIVPIVGGMVLVLVGFGSLSFTDSIFISLPMMFLAGFGLPITNITLSSLFNVKVPLEVLGRASSMLQVLIQSAKPLSLSVTASLLILFSVRDLFLYISIFGFLIVLLMLLNPTVRKAE